MKSFITTLCLSICLLGISVLLSCVDGNEPDPELTTVYEDADGDGFGNANESDEVPVDDIPTGYVSDDTDCDDTNASINPDADEIPDNDVDENCDGKLDARWYLDADEDGYGDSDEVQVSDLEPEGYVSNGDDCNDSDADINPDADEIPDNDIDENCDEELDQTWYRDNDDDGYGDPEQSQVSSTMPEGYVANSDDCDDSDADINPDADEVPDNDIDENCDGELDQTWYRDNDDDGYGDPNQTQVSVSQPTGYVSNDQDCNDTNELVNPGATEICNGIDDNCNGLVDDDDPNVSATTWFRDADGDGYGIPFVTKSACVQPVGYVSNTNDCDDTRASVHPGATEICDNGMDDDCDGLIDFADPDCN